MHKDMKIIVTRGVPASGKSTWAKEFVKDKKDWVIVNRDSIREGTGEYWVPSREDYITNLEEHAVKAAIENKLNVIIDATNLNEKTFEKWKNLAFDLGCEFEVQQFEITLEEALKRDKERGENGGRAVGKKVLFHFFEKYFPEYFKYYMTDARLKDPNYMAFEEKKSRMKSAIIIDLDGTVALHDGRSPYDFAACSSDKPNAPLIDLIEWCGNAQLLFVSGREGTPEHRKLTEDWLYKHINPVYCKDWKLYMREAGDFRKDAIIKEEIYHRDIEPYYNVKTVFDDRDQCIEMWRRLGLCCCQVYYGDF